MIDINENGGVVPDSAAERRRAKNTDLVTLPEHVRGTNCGNCQYVRVMSGFVGMCVHPKVNQPVTARMCCALWDAPGTIRDF